MSKFDIEDNYNEEYDDIDIDGTIEAIRAAWRCVPDMSLSELLDSATPVPFCEMSNSELISSLNEFTHQNQ